MFNKFLGATTVAAALMAASSVSAASISFNRTETFTTGSLTFSNGTTSVDISGATLNADGSTTGDTAGVSSYAISGAGVCSVYCDWQNTVADRQVDGAANREGLLLDFGPTLVKLTSVVLTYVDGDDTFDLFNMGNGAAAGVAPTVSSFGNALPDGSWQVSLGLPDVGVGSLFNFAALDAESEFKVKAIRFDVVPQISPQRIALVDEVASVPLPAGGLLLLGALGGLAVARRRRKG